MKSKNVTLPFTVLKKSCRGLTLDTAASNYPVYYCDLKPMFGPCELRSCPLLKEGKQKNG